LPELPEDLGQKIKYYNVAIGEWGNRVSWVHQQESPVTQEDAGNWAKNLHSFTRDIGGRIDFKLTKDK